MAHKLKIELRHSDHKIYRTVIVPENFNFHQLHIVLQCVMNWENDHLYQFNVGAPYASDSIKNIQEEEFGFFGGNRYQQYEATKTYLSDYFNGRQKTMNYIYDFGDDWIHIITVQKKPSEEVMFPQCIKGEHAAPFEDCGGIPGFYHIKELMDKKRKNREEKEMLEWYGLAGAKSYEEVCGFDIEEVNLQLREVFRDYPENE